jgi:hypothetical protein
VAETTSRGANRSAAERDTTAAAWYCLNQTCLDSMRKMWTLLGADPSSLAVAAMTPVSSCIHTSACISLSSGISEQCSAAGRCTCKLWQAGQLHACFASFVRSRSHGHKRRTTSVPHLTSCPQQAAAELLMPGWLQTQPTTDLCLCTGAASTEAMRRSKRDQGAYRLVYSGRCQVARRQMMTARCPSLPLPKLTCASKQQCRCKGKADRTLCHLRNKSRTAALILWAAQTL